MHNDQITYGQAIKTEHNEDNITINYFAAFSSIFTRK